LQTVADCVDMMYNMITTMTVNKERMLGVMDKGFINATDLADYLVTKDVPFREAHGVVGSVVKYCIAENLKLEDVPLEMMKQFSDKIDEDVYAVLSIEMCVERRNSYGGTSPSSVDVQIVNARESVTDIMNRVTEEFQSNEKCWTKLLG